MDGTDFERFPQHEKQPEEVEAEKEEEEEEEVDFSQHSHMAELGESPVGG